MSERQRTERLLRAGDKFSVDIGRQDGERRVWTLACDQDNYEVVACGWPEEFFTLDKFYGDLKATLVSKATAAERLRVLRETAQEQVNGSRRVALAQQQLDDEDEPPPPFNRGIDKAAIDRTVTERIVLRKALAELLRTSRGRPCEAYVHAMFESVTADASAFTVESALRCLTGVIDDQFERLVKEHMRRIDTLVERDGRIIARHSAEDKPTGEKT